MAVDKYFPALTDEGWVTDKQTIMEKLFLYYITSEKSQSSLFRNDVKSLRYTLQQHKEEYYIKENIKNDLDALYGSFFPIVEVIVETETTDSKADFIINVICYDSNKEKYSLQRILDYKESAINNFQNLLESIRKK